ncbi:hypothetical protein G6L28_05420 [Agrobacterium larrymoorei]|uniref:hypothetical protein n=1 Tax=Agrobacterium larrymoorei TaxID=160699 RepID=UPI001573969D|nr:hypothetical protein [Agrobacterium larrymoorei]NTJ42042.1 hypothetical protein [Agrobacterium larrymoorei]
MTDRTIAGIVNADGTIRAGDEFSVSRTSEGHYVVSFRPAFDQLHGVSATQVFPNDGNTRDNVVIIRLSESELFLKTGDGDGNAKNRDFTFVAAGNGKKTGR